jgi:hypothetical protein
MVKMNSEQLLKAKVVALILSKEPEEALELLSRFYKIEAPELKVGMPKRHGKNPACYTAKDHTIHVVNRENLHNPFLILHEFYHHLRTHAKEHKGTEGYADKFALDFIEAYNVVDALISTKREK